MMKHVGVYAALLAAVTVSVAGTGLVQAGMALTTELVASGLERPTYVTAPPGDTARLFILEQKGIIKILNLDTGIVNPVPFLDIQDRVRAPINGADERGLFSLAFHPRYHENGKFYVYYYRDLGGTILEQYNVTADPDIADPSSNVTITGPIAQPFTNHNGGSVAFSPLDDKLYLSTGDGGSACDPGDRAQNTGMLLGKLLRFDVDIDPPYIPADNPYVGAGDPLDEIWAIGLRNPWRTSFDRATGDLYIADVGQGSWEEIDFQPASSTGTENYGWRNFEGTHCPGCGSPCSLPDHTEPIWEYSHPTGFSITGGYVYRGCQIAGLQGTYFFADFATNRIWSFRYSGGSVTEFTDRTTELAPGGGLAISSISSFGEDAAGEIYIVDHTGATTGEVYRIVAAGPGDELDGLAPEVRHAGTGAAHWGGYVDPRLESNDGINVNRGIDQVIIEFTEPVQNVDCSPLDESAFSIRVTGGVNPGIVSVDASGNPVVVINLGGIIPLQEWTTIEANVIDFAGNPIPNLGDLGPGVDEPDRIDIAFLPGDTSQNGTVLPLDNTLFRGLFVGAIPPNKGPLEYYIDIDRSGAVLPLDNTRWRQLLIGVPPATRSWMGESLNNPRP